MKDNGNDDFAPEHPKVKLKRCPACGEKAYRWWIEVGHGIRAWTIRCGEKVRKSCGLRLEGVHPAYQQSGEMIKGETADEVAERWNAIPRRKKADQ